MEREKLEKLTVVQLKARARKERISSLGDKETLIANLLALPGGSGSLQDEESQTEDVEEDIAGTAHQIQAGLGIQETAPMATHMEPNAMAQILTAFTRQMQQQAEAINRLVESLNQPTRTTAVPVEEGMPSPRSQSDSSRGTRTSAIGSATPAQAVTLLAPQIPEYKGTEEENVRRWIQRVEKVAQVHRAPDDVTLLAASSRLGKTARRWFDLGSGSMIESWMGFKEAIIKRFDRKILFHVALQKAEARKWNFAKETFQEYAMDKLTLIHRLDLPEEDQIHLLISGIGDRLLRVTASALRADDVDHFLHEMHRITSATQNFERKSTGGSKADRGDQQCYGCGKKGHIQKNCYAAESICGQCKTKGHFTKDCPRGRKEQPTAKAASMRSSTAATISAVSETAESAGNSAETEEVVGYVSPQNLNGLSVDGSPLKINIVNGKPCELFALLDTGSPVSFIIPKIYTSHFGRTIEMLSPSTRNLTAVNNTPVEIHGVVKSAIGIDQLPGRTFPIEFQVLKENKLGTHMIIGRDFLDNNEVAVTYKPNKKEKISLSNTFHAELAGIGLCEMTDKFKELYESIEIDFDTTIKKNLIETLRYNEKQSIPVIEDNYCVKINLKDELPYAYAPRRFAFAEKEQLRTITDDLLARGIIKNSVSPYCSRIVPVKKKNGNLRLCVDLRPLNNKVIKQKYPFPLIEDCISNLGGKSVFTLLDLKDGFHNIKVHPEYTKFFSFATPDGQFEYTRLPFGYCEAPAEFQKRLVQILQPLIRKNKVIVYIDDILIASDSIEANLETLKEVMCELKKYNFELNWQKCHFLKKSIEYLGYIISEQGITLSERHTQAIKDFPVPKNVHEVRRFLGLTSYFRKFIRDFAIKAKPLYILLKKEVDFKIDANCMKAFESLKKELLAFPVLRIYNPTAETQLHTDASSVGLGAILHQKQSEGIWAPIAYFSQSTNQAEARYHSYELEMLAIVKSIERFHIYLYGLEFTIITDCNALVYAMNKANLNPRIARWALHLQNYRFKVEHRAGNKMTHVDALSRMVGYIDTLPLERELEYRQLQDSKIKTIAENLEFQDDNKFQLIEGLVFTKDSDRPRFVVPDAMINNIIRIHHDETGHCGNEKTFQGIYTAYWFPTMRKQIRDYIDNCVTCLMADASSNSKEGELQARDNPTSPLEILHIDHFGPLEETKGGYRHIFIVVDAYTRFTWLFPVKSTGTKEAIKHLEMIIHIFGKPKEIVTDRGTAFTSNEFEKFIQEWDIKQRKVAVASPWANGIVERVNRFLKTTLKKTVDLPKKWKVWLFKAQYVINNSMHSVTGSSPSKLLLGYDQRNHTDASLIEFITLLAKIDKTIVKEREASRESASAATDKIRSYNKQYFDARHKKPTMYHTGQYVLLRDLQPKPGINNKLKPSYKGPYIIASTLPNNRYVVQDIPGFNVTSRPYNSILSADKIKPWIKPV